MSDTQFKEGWVYNDEDGNVLLIYTIDNPSLFSIYALDIINRILKTYTKEGYEFEEKGNGFNLTLSTGKKWEINE